MKHLKYSLGMAENVYLDQTILLDSKTAVTVLSCSNRVLFLINVFNNCICFFSLISIVCNYCELNLLKLII